MPRSSAITVAIRFSKPSPSLSEKGRLSGSAHTRSALGSAGGACAEAAKAAIAAHDTTRSKPRMLRGMRFTKGPPGTLDDEPVPARRPAPTALDRRIPLLRRNLLVQAEHRQHSALGAELVGIAERAESAQACRRVLVADSGGDADAGPSADPGEDGDVLLAVRSQVRHRVADDPGRSLEPPELLAGLPVDRLEPAFHRSVEDQAAGGGECPAIRRERLLDLPDHLALRGVPGDEAAAIAARAREHAHDGADGRLADRVLHFHAFVIHADVVGRDVEEARLGTERRRLLVLVADGRRADAGGVLLRGGPVLRIPYRDTGREVNFGRPVHARPERLRDQHLAVGAIDRVA